MRPIQALLFLTNLYLPIGGHAFQTRYHGIATRLTCFSSQLVRITTEFVEIPEILLLTSHSFLTDDRTVPNSLSWYCYPFNAFFIPPQPVLLRVL
jgi:hypothetical protein